MIVIGVVFALACYCYGSWYGCYSGCCYGCCSCWCCWFFSPYFCVMVAAFLYVFVLWLPFSPCSCVLVAVFYMVVVMVTVFLYGCCYGCCFSLWLLLFAVVVSVLSDELLGCCPIMMFLYEAVFLAFVVGRGCFFCRPMCCVFV